MTDAQIIFSPLPVPDLLAQMREMFRAELQAQKQAELQERLLTPKETADLLRVSLVTLWQWEKQGRIIKHQIGGRTYFKYSELMASLERLQRYSKPTIVRRAAK